MKSVYPHTIEELREIFTVDTLNGGVYRRGTNVANNRPNDRGYVTVSVGSRAKGDRQGYKIHRLIWALVHGEWPIEIDHINGDPGDNRLANLREVDRAGNMRNTARVCDRYPGVAPRDGKWTARISVGDSYVVQLGTFATEAEAIAARCGAERVLGYHPNHGRVPSS
jgi:hypothetical protein